MKRNTLIVIGVGVVVVIGAVVAVVLMSGDNSNTSTNSSTENTQSTEYSKAEVALHASVSDCWTIIDGTVYDITGYITSHPGGETITQACGTDGTALFTQRKTAEGTKVGSGTPHSQSANQQLAEYAIGTLAP